MFGADEQLFDLTSYTPRRARHDRQPALEGRVAREGADLHEGPHHDPEERGRDRQLPRRVRDEPARATRAPSRSRRSRSTSPTAGGRRIRARSARSTNRSSSTSRAEASRPTRRASSSCSASWNRSSHACRSVMPRIACAACSRPSGPRARTAVPVRERPQPDATTTCPRRRESDVSRLMRRIDLCGVDEVPEGTMKMCYVDGTDQVLVVTPTATSTPSRASARTSTSSWTRDS